MQPQLPIFLVKKFLPFNCSVKLSKPQSWPVECLGWLLTWLGQLNYKSIWQYFTHNLQRLTPPPAFPCTFNLLGHHSSFPSPYPPFPQFQPNHRPPASTQAEPSVSEAESLPQNFDPWALITDAHIAVEVEGELRWWFLTSGQRRHCSPDAFC